jgi:hypothetical protein
MPAQPPSRLYDASGQVERLRTSPLFAIGPAAPGPALRRGALVAVPVAIALIFEFSLDWPSRGAIATAAFICSLTALDAPAGPRAAWQAATAPFVGIAAALGVLSSQWAPAAMIAMGLIAAAAGYCFADTLRLAFAAFSCAVALMIAQGLFLPAHDALPVLGYATAGGAIQAAWALIVWLLWDKDEDNESGWDWARTKERLRANWTWDSPVARHAVRYGVCLAIGVGIYRVADLHEHGYWIPLTILFVLRPERDETDNRLILRAAGTFLGLVFATGLALLFDGAEAPIAIALSLAAALTCGLITVQYALFTAAVTTYVVLLSDTLGEPPLHSAWQRALGTVVGIGIAWIAFRLLPAPGEARRLR